MRHRLLITALIIAMLTVLTACQDRPAEVPDDGAAKSAEETEEAAAEEQEPATDEQAEEAPAAADEPAAQDDKEAAAEETAAQDETEAAAEETATVEKGEPHPGLLDPSKANETAPEKFRVAFETTAGNFTIEVTRSWAPLGADRVYNLAKIGYYEDVAFFRVIPGFMVQFGIHGQGAVNNAWREARIKDDPVVKSNEPGYVTFAMAGPNTRTTQLFINYGNNAGLDRQGFSPFGKVIEGMDAVKAIHSGYRERPDQGQMQARGNEYLKPMFPELDYIQKVTILD